MKGFCCSKEDRVASKWLGDRPAMVDFVLVLSSLSKTHKGVLMCWGMCITLTKLFRRWEAQLGNLWLPGHGGCRSPFYEAYGKVTRVALVDQCLTSPQDPSHYPLSWDHPTVLCTELYPSTWTYIITYFFPVENFYNNEIILCVHVKFLSLSVFSYLQAFLLD